MCSKHCNLYPADFYTVLGLEWQDLLKTGSELCEYEVKCKDCRLWLDEVRLELLTDIDMKKICEVGLLKQWNAMPRPTISLWKSNTILMRQAHFFKIWMQTTFTGQQ